MSWARHGMQGVKHAILAKHRCFCLHLVQERNVRVGLLPQGEEVLVSHTGARRVTAGHERSMTMNAWCSGVSPTSKMAQL